MQLQPQCPQTEEGKEVQQNAKQISVDGEHDIYFQKSLSKLLSLCPG